MESTAEPGSITSTPTPSTFNRRRIRSISDAGSDSVGAVTAKHGRNRPQHDADVEPERPVLNVLAIQSHDLLEVHDMAATTHLPKTRDARLGTKPPKVVRLVVLEIGFEERTGSHEGHVAPENVPDLRQLVETPTPQKASDPRYARIVRDLEQTRIATVVEADEVGLL